MRYLKLFENYKKIEFLLDKYGIYNYSINPDGSIDANCNVYLDNYKLEFIPIKFNRISADFHCYSNNLETLENSPNYVDGVFIVQITN